MGKLCTKDILSQIGDLLRMNCYYYEGNCLTEFIETHTETCEKILGEEDFFFTSTPGTAPGTYAVVSARFFEHYIAFVPEQDHLLLIGPFLTERPSPVQARQYLRERQIPLAMNRQFLRHYRTMLVCSRRFCNSLPAILEQVFDIAVPFIRDDSEETQGDLLQRMDVKKRYRETILETRTHYRVRSPISLENELLQSIGHGDEKKSIEVLQHINSLDSAIFTDDRLQSKKYSLVAGCALYTRALIHSGVNYTEAFALSDAMIKTIHSIENMESLLRFEYEMVRIFSNTAAVSGHGYTEPVRRMTEYIEANLISPLTLHDVAQQAFLHPHYASGLFKKEVGKSVIAHVLYRRIEESKLLLSDTNESIADIANYYQFCNESYYISVFRRYTGTTPKQYRQTKT